MARETLEEQIERYESGQGADDSRADRMVEALAWREQHEADDLEAGQ